MAQIYSSVLAEVKELEGTSEQVTEGGAVTVIRCIDVFHGQQATQVSGRVVGPGGAAFFGWHFGLSEVIFYGWQGWRGRQVFDELQKWSIIMHGGNADVRVSGYILPKA